MEHLTPETQQFIVNMLWVFVVAAVGVALKVLVDTMLKRIDKLEDSIVKASGDMVTGLQGVRDALTTHHNDLSGRIGRSDGRINVLEFKTDKLVKDVDEIYPRLNKIEQGHAAMAERLEKIVYPAERQ